MVVLLLWRFYAGALALTILWQTLAGMLLTTLKTPYEEHAIYRAHWASLVRQRGRHLADEHT